MGILDFFRSRPKNTASVAKERLRIIVAQERAQQAAAGPTTCRCCAARSSK